MAIPGWGVIATAHRSQRPDASLHRVMLVGGNASASQRGITDAARCRPPAETGIGGGDTWTGSASLGSDDVDASHTCRHERHSRELPAADTGALNHADGRAPTAARPPSKKQSAGPFIGPANACQDHIRSTTFVVRAGGGRKSLGDAVGLDVSRPGRQSRCR
jgi:hypothetical protein